ncbi:hypothetical protein MTR_1g442740 [Medicago truncatula]|uniref:Uncharacterized protein n=1 Tax=Medicago truncatula TaxID=3880 RepID=A0A072VGE9_MEDTR|nr:hypothetical protein MTR_1g442740 [Medicago truncatula]
MGITPSSKTHVDQASSTCTSTPWKCNQPKNSLEEDESAKASSHHQPVRGSFLSLLPPQMETPKKNESQ